MSAPTSTRLLTLLSLLQARREWPGAELSERLEVSPRTLRRDIERLRELGYPVRSVRGPGGSYTLGSGTAMPPLLLDEQEAVAVAIALRTAARSAVSGIEQTAVGALLKLEQVLPGHLRRRVRTLGEVTSVLGGVGGPTVDAEVLMTLARCTRELEMLRLDYEARAGERTRRLVEPHALVVHGRRWYLVAWDPGREGWRSFRVDRIRGSSPAGRRFRQRTIPGGDAGRYVARSLAGAPVRFQARVHYRAPAAQVRQQPAIAYGRGRLEEVDEHSCLYVTGDDDLGWLALRIALVDADFTLEGPPELFERLQGIGRRLLGVAAQSSGVV